MTDEVFPRFGRIELNFLTVDATEVENSIISTYENLTGRRLASGDPVRLFLLTLAAVIIQQRQAFNLAARQNLLTYATGEFLDHLGEFVNTRRLQASGAQTILRFTLNAPQTSAYIIPRGTRVSDSRLIFATDEVLEIAPGETVAEVSATCETLGTVGNGLQIGELIILNDPLPSVSSVTNIDATAGGSDIESDATYAERIRLAPSSFSVAGPHDAYVYHTLAVSAQIVDVSVYGLKNQPGKVFVHPLLEDGVLPNEAMLQAISEALNDETVRPITDLVLVSAPEAVNYKINLTWYLSNENLDQVAQITEAVNAAIEEFRIWQQSKIGRDINPDRLIEMVRGAGAKRMIVTEPVFTAVSQSQVAQCSIENVSVVYGGAEDA